WIPACAGMTNFRFLFLVFCFRGNNGILSFRNLSEKQKSHRRHPRESGNLETKNYRDLPETTNPLRRHSRAGGNLEI
ncbi:TPA: hypothetical protein ACKLZM_002224, partial [Neisseria gonorrhoeae]